MHDGNSNHDFKTIGNDEWLRGIEDIMDEDADLLERLADE